MEKEIDRERQLELSQQLICPPHVYPFQHVELSRADVEWLLATHHGGKGPVDWEGGGDFRRDGLDLRGAILRGVNLSGLPLTRLYARDAALEGAEFVRAHLEVADFVQADLRNANLSFAFLDQANFAGAHLEQARFAGSQLKGAGFKSAWLTGADFLSADLTQAHAIGQTDFTYARLEGANLMAARLERANFGLAHLERANLRGTHLERANLSGASLAGATLANAHLEGAELWSAHLEGKILAAQDLKRIRETLPDYPAVLPPADLRLAFFDPATVLDDIQLGDGQYGFPKLVDVRWNGANLAVVNWTEVTMLGDEIEARGVDYDDRVLQAAIGAGWRKVLRGNVAALRRRRHRRYRQLSRAVRRYTRSIDESLRDRQISTYRTAVRANRQLAAVLRGQGLNEEANRYAYQAQVLQRAVLWRQHEIARLLFSWLSAMLAGYGYRLGRSIGWYCGIIGVSAVTYYLLGMQSGIVLDWAKVFDACAQSVTAFHGRGLFSQDFGSGDWRSLVASIEAIAGLVIEICLIVTFTQRFFEK